ncbi:hypothetical protein [Thermochromatium tepidum]|uniref:hypothetical protein n=1 Tax=Thermochromatium tepidum TaxID=1050 RepID=UPI001B882527|nr:hypothetical protein [Thermochromatium tepidum]
MVEIKHRETGAILGTISADSLVGTDLRDMPPQADLRPVEIRYMPTSRARNPQLPGHKQHLR